MRGIEIAVFKREDTDSPHKKSIVDSLMDIFRSHTRPYLTVYAPDLVDTPCEDHMANCLGRAFLMVMGELLKKEFLFLNDLSVDELAKGIDLFTENESFASQVGEQWFDLVALAISGWLVNASHFELLKRVEADTNRYLYVYMVELKNGIAHLLYEAYLAFEATDVDTVQSLREKLRPFFRILKERADWVAMLKKHLEIAEESCIDLMPEIKNKVSPRGEAATEVLRAFLEKEMDPAVVSLYTPETVKKGLNIVKRDREYFRVLHSCFEQIRDSIMKEEQKNSDKNN